MKSNALKSLNYSLYSTVINIFIALLFYTELFFQNFSNRRFRIRQIKAFKNQMSKKCYTFNYLNNAYEKYILKQLIICLFPYFCTNFFLSFFFASSVTLYILCISKFTVEVIFQSNLLTFHIAFISPFFKRKIHRFINNPIHYYHAKCSRL